MWGSMTLLSLQGSVSQSKSGPLWWGHGGRPHVVGTSSNVSWVLGLPGASKIAQKHPDFSNTVCVFLQVEDRDIVLLSPSSPQN